MAHEIAKLLLEHAESALERQEAIEKAHDLGMPLHEIEQYLDWLDSTFNSARPPGANDTLRPRKRKEP